MKVECIQVFSSTTQERIKKSPWLTVGKTYTVLAISASPGGQISLRMIGDDGCTPGLYASHLFETVDVQMPSSWIATVKTDGRLEIAPAEWLRDGFWEEYFDGDAAAMSAFERARRAIETD